MYKKDYLIDLGKKGKIKKSTLEKICKMFENEEKKN